jgi:hypothetical protein
MTTAKAHISNRPLRTPRAAAIAGIAFAVLQITSYVLLHLAIPNESLESSYWLKEGARVISLALGLLPFAGIAFLWFMGVVRDRLGHLEDQFFSTLFFGSGLLYLAMTFVSAAIAGGILLVYNYDPNLVDSGMFVFARAMIYKFNNVYAIRMAGMHMFVLGTIWFRTLLMPRWLALITYGLSSIMIVSIAFYPWSTLFFPGWVFLISVYILVLNYRYRQEKDGLTLEG